MLEIPAIETGPAEGFPEDLQRLMANIGPVWGTDIQKHGSLVRDAFSKLLEASPKANDVVRNISYGSHPRQILDLYRPDPKRGAAPVVIFVHGGAFIRGDMNLNGLMNANVLTWFSRQGYLGINMEYRLAPETCYPGGADDVASVVAWVMRSAAAHGGDPERTFLVGHSAGGTHAATYSYDPAPGYLGRDVRGVALISARLRADVLPENPNAVGVRAYFGTDESTYEKRAPMLHGASSSLPTFVAIAEFENPLLDVYGAEFFYRMSIARGRAIPFLWLAKHNHISMTAHFNTTEEVLGRRILQFFESVP